MEHRYTSIRLEITSKCNLQCAYCHNAEFQNGSSDMTSEEILKLIQNLKKEYSINKVLLTGGEPLVKKDICHLVEEITQMGIKVDMVTNGTLLTPELVENLERAGLKRIRISLDEVSEKTCIRGNSSPSKLWEMAKYIVDHSKIELCIHTVCSPSNVHSLFEVYQKVLEVGARRWRVFDIGFQGNFVDYHSDFSMKNYYLDLIMAANAIAKDYLSNHYEKILDIEMNNIFRTQFLDMTLEKNMVKDIQKQHEEYAKLPVCNYVSSHQLSVRSDGSGTLCQYFHHPIYQFKDNHFDVKMTVESAKPYEEFTLKMSDLAYCYQCKYCMVCNSGCRSRAWFLTKDMKDADPVACYFHPLVEKHIMSVFPDYVQEIYRSCLLPDGLEPKYSAEEFREFLRMRGYDA